MRAMTGAGELVAFVAARLAEAESQAVLHEVTCTVPGGSGEPTVGWRCCGCPAQRVARVHALQRVLRDCEQRIRHEDRNSPRWPFDVIGAERSLRALARRYDQHPQWHQEWCP